MQSSHDVHRLNLHCSTLNVVCLQTQYIKASVQIHVYNAEDIVSFLAVTPDHIVEIWKKSTVEVAEEHELSQSRVLWWFQSWLWGWDSLKLASEFVDIDQTSSEH